MENKKNEITFKDLINIFLPKAWIVAICAVVLAAVFGIYTSATKDDTYTSDFTMYVYRNATSNNNMQVDEMIEIYAEKIYTREVLGKIVDELPDEYASLGLTPEHISSYLKVSLATSKSIFRVSITTTDPELSLAIAESAEKVIPSVLVKIPDSFALDPWESPYGVSLNSKGTVKNALIGFLIGALVSAIVIFIIAMFDVVVRKRKDIEDNFNIPILGVIPHYEAEKSNGGK